MPAPPAHQISDDTGAVLRHHGCPRRPRGAQTIAVRTTRGLDPDYPPAGLTHEIGWLGTLWQAFTGWGFTFLFAAFATLASLLTLGRLSNVLTPKLLNFWSRVMLRIMRIDLDVEGMEHVSPRSMKVVLFNHGSLADAMIVTAIKPLGGVSAIKREALYIPFVGAALWSLGFLLIDRGRTERARRVLSRAANRMAQEKLTVFMAPEGTRSPDGRIRAFRKGAFHIARVSGAPFVPMVIDGASEVQPLGRAVSHAGRVRVRFLPAVETTGMTVDDLPEMVERMRDIMVAELGRMRAERGADPDADGLADTSERASGRVFT